MKLSRITGFVAVLLLVIASLVVPASAQDTGVEVLSAGAVADATGPIVDETPQSYFVELQSLPAVEGTSVTTLKQEKANFRNAANKAGIKFEEKYAFDSLFNGLSVKATPAAVAALSRMPEVKAVWPVIAIAAPQATVQAVSEPDLFTAVNMTGASIAQNELGYTGKGVKVGVIDTGVDYNHPDLGGGWGKRVVIGYDFVGDSYNADSTAASYQPVPHPDSDPMDCGGHGSHVAGIIGANGFVKGVAPEVTFGAYRVFGCEGSTESDIMLQAMEKAQADGMQVINMSIGSAYQWAQYPTAVAATRLVNKGVVVVASIGNDGAKGLWSNGAPGVGEKVIGVASFENTSIYLPQFSVDNANYGYVNATAAPTAPKSGSFELARTGTQTTVNDGCNALPAGSLAGKVALIRRGTCGFYNKALNAQLAGAAGVVLYNNQVGSVNPTVAPVAPLTTTITIPVVMISQVQGNQLDSRLAAGPATMTWTDTMGSYPNSLGNRLSDFTSYGMTPDLTLKPDIAGPGGNIYSTYPLAKGGYTTMSGTSMSSPHVAGTVALLLQAKPHTPAQAVRAILQNTAEPKNWSGNPALGYLDFSFRQGAGMVQIDKAILATANVEPGKLSLGESQNGPSVQTLTVTNNGTEAVTFTVKHTPTLSVGPNPWLAPSVMTGFADVTFSAPTVTVPAGGSAQVTATITANSTLPDGSMYGGYIVFEPQNNGQKLRVPYAGYKGDYQALQAMKATSYGFPWLSNLSGGSYHRLADGATFTMQNGDIPYAVIHFEHAARRIRIEVRDAVTGKDWHVAAQEEYIPMNSTNTGIFAWAFDGTTTAGNKTYTVPNGKYVMVVSVEKALGSDSNPADWETWTSPIFEIARP